MLTARSAWNIPFPGARVLIVMLGQSRGPLFPINHILNFLKRKVRLVTRLASSAD